MFGGRGFHAERGVAYVAAHLSPRKPEGQMSTKGRLCRERTEDIVPSRRVM